MSDCDTGQPFFFLFFSFFSHVLIFFTDDASLHLFFTFRWIYRVLCVIYTNWMARKKKKSVSSFFCIFLFSIAVQPFEHENGTINSYQCALQLWQRDETQQKRQNIKRRRWLQKRRHHLCEHDFQIVLINWSRLCTPLLHNRISSVAIILMCDTKHVQALFLPYHRIGRTISTVFLSLFTWHTQQHTVLDC